MKDITQKYNLADSELLDQSLSGINMMLWRPRSRAVVIGNSNEAVQTCDIPNVLKDNVPVYKRPSGGESVVLTENMLIISIVSLKEGFGGTKSLFNQYNELIIAALSELGIDDLGLKGISDIAIGNKKILGSAMYRNKNKTFYHAVLNISEEISIISKYLKHPEREPDYRKGRDHKEFVTSLLESGSDFEIDDIKSGLERTFSEYYGSGIQFIYN